MVLERWCYEDVVHVIEWKVEIYTIMFLKLGG